MKNLGHWKKGDPIWARRLEKMSAEIRAGQNISVAAPLQMSRSAAGMFLSVRPLEPKWWLGELDATGQTPYTDCRYWVKQQYVDNDSSTATEQISNADLTHPEEVQVTATNLAEVKSDTHLLAAGTEVLVFEMDDDFGTTAPPTTRHVFHALTPEAVEETAQDVAGIENFLDIWVDCGAAGGSDYISTTDWRGQAIWYSVRPYVGTAANADPDEWDDDAADYQDVRCCVVGYDWDSDSDEVSDILLWQTGQTKLYLEADTGKLLVVTCGQDIQIRVTVRATGSKTSSDVGMTIP